jgi:alpha 1,3-glucosidase
MMLNLENIHRKDVTYLTSTQAVWAYGDYKYILTYSPISIQGFYKGSLIYHINERSLLNFERYRTRETVMGHNNYNILDATGVPGDYPLWEEKWRDFTDNNPRGPSSIGLDITFAKTLDIYGIPEHSDSLSLIDTENSEPYRLYNLDVFEYELNERMTLYGNIPFILNKNGGFFWNNPSETWVDVQSSAYNGDNSKRIHWFSETGVLDIFLFLAANPMDLVQTFTRLTGPPSLPPLFSIAYHQCRWNYFTQKEVEEIEQGFEDHDIPMDVIWLDIEHTPNRMYFTWDYSSFPEPVKMINELAEHGRKLVTIVDPHMSKRKNFPVGQGFKDKGKKNIGYYVKNENGDDYEGHCWPGTSSWPDFMREETREYWASQFELQNYKDTTLDVFIWNDMNEPAVFGGPENSMPKTNLHMFDVEHREIHNLYGIMTHRATYEGLIKRSPNDRPFILSRAFYAGSQKYGAIWTGDNMAKWEYMEVSVPMCLGVTLGGLSFCGSDVGGFFYNPSAELMERWYQIGAYSPFFRSHAHIETEKREPWVFGEESLVRIRESLRERYRLLPYWYTLFYEHAEMSLPIMRPLFMMYTEDPNVSKIDKQYFVGDGMMVTGLSQPSQKSVKLYVPEGRWFDFHGYKEIFVRGSVEVPVSKDAVPVYLRGGHIIPMQNRQRRSSALMKNDPYSLLVVLDSGYKAHGNLFVDDFKTFNYKTGNYLTSVFEFSDNSLRYSVDHPWSSSNAIETITILGLSKAPNHVRLESGCGNQDLYFTSEDQVLTIKMAKAKINESWVVVLGY